jgi:hypothetical protein
MQRLYLQIRMLPFTEAFLWYFHASTRDCDSVLGSLRIQV